MTNPNDQIRQQILQYFYDRNHDANSERGKRGSHVKISVVKSELKTKHGLNQKEVTAQLTYLISSGWVAKVVDDRTYTTPGGTQRPRAQEWYVITAAGIDRIEEASSAFMRQSPYSNVNITAVNSAVQLGNGNVVSESFVGIAEELESLTQAVARSELTEEEKLSVISDIDTINSQLAKQNPNSGIIESAWNTIANGKAGAFVKSAAGFAKLSSELGRLFGG